MSQNSGPSSSSWVSFPTEMKTNLQRLQNNASHIGLLRSPYFPSSLPEFVEHELEWSAIQKMAMNKKLRDKIVMSEVENITEVNVEHSTSKDDVAKFAYGIKKGKERARVAGSNAQDMERKNMFSTVAEETRIWKPDYTLLPQKTDPSSPSGTNTRSSWPDQNELKAEGEQRMVLFGERRFPLPRLDRYSKEVVIVKVASGATVKELVRVKGADISWYERDLVSFTGLDSLPSIDRERLSQGKIWSHKGIMSRRIGGV